MTHSKRPNTLSREDLIAEVAVNTGFPANRLRKVLNAMFGVFGPGHKYDHGEIALQMAAGQNIELRGFAFFWSQSKSPRPARNPRTGEVVQIPRRNVAKFQASPNLTPTRKP